MLRQSRLSLLVMATRVWNVINVTAREVRGAVKTMVASLGTTWG